MDLKLVIPGKAGILKLTGKRLLTNMGSHVAWQFACRMDYLVTGWALIGHL